MVEHCLRFYAPLLATVLGAGQWSRQQEEHLLYMVPLPRQIQVGLRILLVLALLPQPVQQSLHGGPVEPVMSSCAALELQGPTIAAPVAAPAWAAPARWPGPPHAAGRHALMCWGPDMSPIQVLGLRNLLLPTLYHASAPAVTAVYPQTLPQRSAGACQAIPPENQSQGLRWGQD
jgi:hypothetical protein